MGRGSRVRSSPEAETFTAMHREFVGFGICRVIRRSSTTMKAHTYYIIFGRPPIGEGGGKLPPVPPWRRHCVVIRDNVQPFLWPVLRDS